MKCNRGRGILLGGREAVGERPRRQRRLDRPDRASDLPLDPCEDRAGRDESACGATIEGRFSRRQIADHLGLHRVTIGGIVRAQELEKRPDGKTASKRKQGSAVDRDTNTKDLTRYLLRNTMRSPGGSLPFSASRCLGRPKRAAAGSKGQRKECAHG